MADGLLTTALDAYHNAGIAAIVTTPFISLHSGAPGTNGANELSGNGYARQAITLTTSSSGIKSNANDITFGPASAAWAVWYYGLWTASTGGTFLGYWTIKDSNGDKLVGTQAIGTGESVIFAIGDLTFTAAIAA